MSEDNLFEIAKIVDNDFISKKKTFTAKRFLGYYHLTTNVCDYASLIRVYTLNNKISSIVRCGEDTEGYQPIHNATWLRIENYLNTLNNKQSEEITLLKNEIYALQPSKKADPG